MRLSTVFELLLIFLIIAFAAYGRVIDRDGVKPRHIARSSRHDKNMGVSIMSLKEATENINKYCNCDEQQCNCCRKFHIPTTDYSNEGCASLKYFENNDSLGVQLNFGKNILATKMVKAKEPESICMKMPGGFSEFCGKIYSIQREEDNHFKACLGLELRSPFELEASLRVSCFRFGRDGIKLLPAEEFPVVETPNKAEEEEDDDEDIFGFDDDDDDEESEDTDASAIAPVKDTVATSPKPAGESDDDDDDDDDDDEDVLGFGELFDLFTDDDDEKKKSTTTAAPFIIPTVTKPTIAPELSVSSLPTDIKKPIKPSVTLSPIGNEVTTRKPQKVPVKKPIIKPVTTVKPDIEVTTEQMVETSTAKIVDDTGVTEESITITTITTNVDAIEVTDVTVEATTVSAPADEKPIEESASAVEIATLKPEIPAMIVKKIIVGTDKKPSVGSSHLNAIKNEKKKPLVRPIKPDPAAAVAQGNNNEDEDEDIDISASVGLDDLDDLEENEEHESGEEDEAEEEEDDDDDDDDDDEKEVEHGAAKPEDDNDEEIDILKDLVGDSDEEEDEVINGLVSDGGKKDKNKIKEKEKDKILKDDKNSDKVADNMASKPEEDDADYGLNLGEFMARGRHLKSGRGRQSKVMRL